MVLVGLRRRHKFEHRQAVTALSGLEEDPARGVPEITGFGYDISRYLHYPSISMCVCDARARVDDGLTYIVARNFKTSPHQKNV